MTSHPEFNSATTAIEAANAFSDQVKDRYVVITGTSANSIGEATAVAIAQHSPRLLILASRTQSKLDSVAAAIRASTHNAVAVATVLLDLASQASVRRAAAAIQALAPRIDVLINNAGVLLVQQRQQTVDGIEMHLGLNHVGHFLLTNLLLDQLLAAAGKEGGKPARVINVSSDAHAFSPFRFADPNFSGAVADADLPAEQRGAPLDALPDDLRRESPSSSSTDGSSSAVPFHGMRAYAQSKTANILFTVALNERLRSRGVVAYSLHPGAVASEGLRSFFDKTPGRAPEDVFAELGMPLKDVGQGASTTVVAALDPALDEVKDGVYLADCQFLEPQAYAKDPVAAEKLWKLSEELVGQQFL